MPFVKIDPPGTFCMKEALRDALKTTPTGTFLDVGCGGGGMSKLLCDAGWTGVGVDFSEAALSISRELMAEHIAERRYTLHSGDVLALPPDFGKADLVISYMVMEHVEDDVGFVQKIADCAKLGGTVILGVPGRRDRWSVEDETVGHFRRYDRQDLEHVMTAAGLDKVAVWSIAVPIANILFNLSVWLIGRSSETAKAGQSQRAQTETSGIREIAWKTVFPAWVKLFLNCKTMLPLFILQRLFYRSGLGITMMGTGRVPSHRTSA
jgi:SAM-dependent methyltransferase